ncbi:MAG: hypothetical protein L6R28_20070 [Planctomycetes bacterium]|nr:hypothetical protein [Planctomycetota bacterium]
MAEPPKRRAWFQLHLSTCVVLMVVAGALGCVNFIPFSRGAPEITHYCAYGWPLLWAFEYRIGTGDFGVMKTFNHQSNSAVIRFSINLGDVELSWGVRDLGINDYSVEKGHGTFKSDHRLWMVADIVISLAIVALIGTLLEWRIRRRLRRGASKL